MVPLQTQSLSQFFSSVELLTQVLQIRLYLTANRPFLLILYDNHPWLSGCACCKSYLLSKNVY